MMPYFTLQALTKRTIRCIYAANVTNYKHRNIKYEIRFSVLINLPNTALLLID